MKAYTLGDQLGQVIRKVLRMQGGWAAPNQLPEHVQPVLEGRSLRAWEEYDEGIVRWGRQFIVGAGAAGQESGVHIRAPAGQKYLLCIDAIENNSAAGNLTVVSATNPAWTLENFSGVFAKDTRWGINSMFDGMCSSGDVAAIPGTALIGNFGAGVRKDNLGLVSLPNPDTRGFGIFNLTAATAAAIAVEGRLIPIE